jgi:hypothetical protein
MNFASKKIKILSLLFALLLIISLIGSVSANDVWAGQCKWEGSISVNDGKSYWQTITPIHVQKGSDGLYHTPPIHFNIKLDSYPKTVNGFYFIELNESGHIFLIQSDHLAWNYAKGDDGANIVDDFKAHQYDGATWHFIWTSYKLILSDYYDAYSPVVPKNDTPIIPGKDINRTVPGNDANTSVPSGKDTIPMQNTGMPIILLIIALISIITGIMYHRYKE